VESLIRKQEQKVFLNIIRNDEEVLVSDFVDIDDFQKRTKLGFLLSEHLKNSLAVRNIIVKEVEFLRSFEFGNSGLNVLTRNYKKIIDKEVSNKYAFVGTYSTTIRSLIVFVKLIEIETGNIISSASGSILIDEEIRDLERSGKTSRVHSPLVL
jgi:hypothetical protein